jgi:hypothetical protein
MKRESAAFPGRKNLENPDWSGNILTGLSVTMLKRITVNLAPFGRTTQPPCPTSQA